MFDPIFDLFGRRDHNIDIFAQGKAKVLRGAEIERIDQRDAEGVSAYSNRQRTMQPRQTARNQTQNFRSNFLSCKIDKFRGQAIGDGLVKAELIDKAAIDHGLRDCFAI